MLSNGRGVGCAIEWARAADPSSAPPHSPQNFSPGWTGAAHFGQVTTRGAPQFVQNLRPSRLSLPHFEQRIFVTERLIAQVIEQGLGVFQVAGVEALGEPLVGFVENTPCLIAITLLVEQACKAEGCS